MEKRQLGNSGLETAPLAFGGNVFGWTIDEKISFELLDAFTDAGFNLIDTADSYSRWKPGNQGGESETIIGNWMKQRNNRKNIIVATKLGSDMGGNKKGLSQNYIFQAVEDSLKRLQTDYIDVYQSHYDDLSTPVAETIDAFAELIRQGKIRTFGASNFSVERLTESLLYSEQNGLPRYQTYQPEYNLYNREGFEKEYQAICVEHGIGVISYFSLASGFLSGKYRSENDLTKSVRGGGIKKYLNERGHLILDALDEVAFYYETTPASISLAWLMAQSAIVAPIASATNIEQLNELINAAHLQLDENSIDLLSKASEYRERKT
jgi:aryl-alcohol dehydrogenase-like predicted oxidoreductase